jgi:hypothetical protein
MGKVNRKKKHLAILRKKHAGEKIRKLKAKYQTADGRERQTIFDKIRKISPAYPASELQASKK